MLQNHTKIFQISIDNSVTLCYNIDTIKEKRGIHYGKTHNKGNSRYYQKHAF